MFKKLTNNRGIVFILVITIILIMMVLTVSIISINSGHIINTTEEIHRVQAETLALGAKDYAFALIENSSLPSSLLTENLDGMQFSVTASQTGEDVDLDVSY